MTEQKHIEANRPIILIAPLDWGLGHATRCIPIITHLINCNCIVIIAAEGRAKVLLQLEFPSNKIIPLKGYRIRYTRYKRMFAIKILYQIPKILRAVKAEQQWLNQVIAQYNLDAVIADNRYGLWSRDIPSVFITHQLNIKAPNKYLEWLLRKINYRYINRFSQCWIPDEEGKPNLAGMLSHPVDYPATAVSYLGGLSRLKASNTNGTTYQLLIVLSGPEPQRSLLEKQLLTELETFGGKVLLVRGLPGQVTNSIYPQHVQVVPHLTAVEMEKAYQQSELLISRSGYTTVMDIIKLKKRAILIPTPGQSEQEYLGSHLQSQGICLCIPQHRFSLDAALSEVAHFNYQIPAMDTEKYKSTLDSFVAGLKKQAKT